MKDAVLCNKLRGIEKQVLIRRCPNGESRPKGQSKVVASEIDGTQCACKASSDTGLFLFCGLRELFERSVIRII